MEPIPIPNRNLPDEVGSCPRICGDPAQRCQKSNQFPTSAFTLRATPRQVARPSRKTHARQLNEIESNMAAKRRKKHKNLRSVTHQRDPKSYRAGPFLHYPKTSISILRFLRLFAVNDTLCPVRNSLRRRISLKRDPP